MRTAGVRRVVLFEICFAALFFGCCWYFGDASRVVLVNQISGGGVGTLSYAVSNALEGDYITFENWITQVDISNDLVLQSVVNVTIDGGANEVRINFLLSTSDFKILNTVLTVIKSVKIDNLVKVLNASELLIENCKILSELIIEESNNIILKENQLSKASLSGIDTATLLKNTIDGGGVGITSMLSQNIVIKSNEINSTTGDGVKAIFATNLTIVDNFVATSSFNGIFVSRSHLCDITSNKVFSRRYGIQVYQSNYTDVHNNTIYVNDTIAGLDSAAILISSSYFSITSNTVRSVAGINSPGSTHGIIEENDINTIEFGVAHFFTNTVITNNEINTIKKEALYLLSSDNLTISKNKLFTAEHYCILISSGTGINVTHNQIRSLFRGISLSDINNLLVELNNVTADSTGIYLRNTAHVTINSQWIESNQHGIYADSVTQATIFLNRLHTGYGMFLHAANSSEIYNNHVIAKNAVIPSNSSESGIYLNFARGCDVYSNILELGSASIRLGIQYQWSSDSTVANNTIKSSGNNTSTMRGIYIRDSVGMTISSNFLMRLTSVNSVGILATRSSTLTVFGNTFTDFAGLGILIDSSSEASVENNLIQCDDSLHSIGILVQHAANNHITSNSIRASYGIWMNDSASTDIILNEISTTSLTNPTNEGVHVLDSNNCSVKSNTIWLHEGISLGIVYSASNGSNISNNTIFGTSSFSTFGIYLVSLENANITSNHISEVSNCGIYSLRLSNSIMLTNNVSNNEDYGFIIENSEIILESNLVHNNEVGIELRNAENNLLRSNIVSFNRHYGILVNCALNLNQSSGCPNAFDANLIGFNVGGIVPLLPISNGTPAINEISTHNQTVIINASLMDYPNRDYIFQFFANSECDSLGFGEGEIYLGSSIATSNAFGSANSTFSYDLRNNLLSVSGSLVPLSSYCYLTMTSTLVHSVSEIDKGDITSKFSQCISWCNSTTSSVSPSPTSSSSATASASATVSTSESATVSSTASGSLLSSSSFSASASATVSATSAGSTLTSSSSASATVSATVSGSPLTSLSSSSASILPNFSASHNRPSFPSRRPPSPPHKATPTSTPKKS